MPEEPGHEMRHWHVHYHPVFRLLYYSGHLYKAFSEEQSLRHLKNAISSANKEKQMLSGVSESGSIIGLWLSTAAQQ